MTANHIQGTADQKPLRLWPGVVLAILVGLLRYVVPAVAPEDFTVFDVPLGFLGFLGGAFSALAIVVWWVFFSRVPWSERVGAIILSIVGLFAVSRMVHESITGGMMGMLLYVYSIPVLSLALVVWAVVAGRLAPGARRASLVAIILLACAPWTSAHLPSFTWPRGPTSNMVPRYVEAPGPISTPLANRLRKK